MSDDDTIRVQLARIEGKQDVTNERLETANKINDERHAAVKLHLGTIDQRLSSHSDRIGGLESRETGRDGERRGLAISGKILWAIAGAIPVGAIAAILRALGT